MLVVIDSIFVHIRSADEPDYTVCMRIIIGGNRHDAHLVVVYDPNVKETVPTCLWCMAGKFFKSDVGF